MWAGVEIMTLARSIASFPPTASPACSYDDEPGRCCGLLPVGLRDNTMPRLRGRRRRDLGRRTRTSTLSRQLPMTVRLSYLYNWWQWSTSAAPADLQAWAERLRSLPVTLQCGSHRRAYPYNVTSQSVRQRVLGKRSGQI